MNYTVALAIALALGGPAGIAQTKLIAFKSHSGNSKNFKTAFTRKLFDMRSSNFGGAPMEYVRNAKLDSVIFISKTKSVMVTSSTCMNRNAKNKSELWNPGRDTVYNHPLFSNQHSLDSIKNELKNFYYFDNNIDEVSFVGFDNHKNVIPEKKVVTAPVVFKKEMEKKNIKKERRKIFKPGSFSKGWSKFTAKARKLFKRKKCASCPSF